MDLNVHRFFHSMGYEYDRVIDRQMMESVARQAAGNYLREGRLLHGGSYLLVFGVDSANRFTSVPVLLPEGICRSSGKSPLLHQVGDDVAELELSPMILVLVCPNAGCPLGLKFASARGDADRLLITALSVNGHQCGYWCSVAGDKLVVQKSIIHLRGRVDYVENESLLQILRGYATGLVEKCR